MPVSSEQNNGDSDSMGSRQPQNMANEAHILAYRFNVKIAAGPGPSAGKDPLRQTNPIRPGHARPGPDHVKQTQFGPAGGRGSDCAKQTQFPGSWPENEDVRGSTNPICAARQPGTGEPSWQTKPISGRRRETGGRSGSSRGLLPPVFGLDAPNKANLHRRGGA
jgi:hypothetical protein